MFSRDRTAPTLAAVQKPVRGAAGSGGLSFIGPEAVVSGDFTTDTQLHIDGRIDGNVKCTQLIQGESGVITGNIETDEARIAGIVEGKVVGRTLFIEATAKIMGDIAYETLSIDAGALIEGRLGRRGALLLDEPPLIATPVSFRPGRTTELEGGAIFKPVIEGDSHRIARTDVDFRSQ